MHYFNKFKLQDNLQELSKIIEFVEKFLIYKVYYEKRSRMNISDLKDLEFLDEINNKEQPIIEKQDENLLDIDENNPLINSLKLDLSRLSNLKNQKKN